MTATTNESQETNMTATQAEAEAAPRESDLRIVQRVVFPANRDLDTLPLYVDPDTNKIRKQEENGPAVVQAVGMARKLHPEDILDRGSVQVRRGERLSFGSYFNAFPASYWRKWTIATKTVLHIETEGEGTVIVYRSNARGAAQRVDSILVEGNASNDFELTLAPFGDGGWYWFDLIAGGDGMTLKKAHWAVASEGRPQSKVTLGVTTFNRADYCLETIKAIDADSGLRGILAELIIVDQGNKKVADEDGFDSVAASMGDQLRIINQGNLGGSGGFARNMYEMLVSDKSDYVMLLDDDIELETEGVMRAVAFADLCRKPTIVGGHMFDMYNKSVLHAYAEVVNFYRFLWGPVEGLGNHDFSAEGLRSTPLLHRRWDADYNGWWMCLIPKAVVEEIGLSLPVFIKWDDAEYSLRARAAGYPTVTLPGAAVWHVSWADKDDSVDWQAYYHERNRLIAALLHSPFPKGGRIFRESLNTDIKHLVSMQYYPEQARIMALRDVLEGPSKLHEQLPTTMPKLRTMREDFVDSQVKTDPGAFPEVFRKRPPKKPQTYKQPGALGLLPWAVKTVLKQTIAPVRESAHSNPEAHVAHQDGKWWSLAHLDSAVVSNADGTGASWYRRDPKLVRKMLAETAQLHAQLFSNWETLRGQYRDALPEITSMDSWRETFEASEPKQ
ncbi:MULTISPECIES: glycosyltransferase [Paenarthrobacter]|uniref:glycosyltransferase n=1 Tax=Paenarthrobacter TaxID=1742992 RepID=UPI00074D3CC8|nr:glycosyltransferase [Paenarthrobacter ureafaciens]AMB41050.1 glycosyl transferase [Arthrobacter sp. ATCC 21022]KUR66066.1 glycosyl transferase [Arthrobacter sp. ATCC 21022]RWW99408.1 glycosyltransferase family 2 protein [Paenarthrobacter ureafaciens]